MTWMKSDRMKKVFVAKEGEIPEGRVASFHYGPMKGIAYNDSGTIKAYVNSCTHAGGRVRLCDEGTLRCEIHEAEFDPKTGDRLCGEAPEGSRLTPIEVVREEGSLFALIAINDEFDF